MSMGRVLLRALGGFVETLGGLEGVRRVSMAWKSSESGFGGLVVLERAD